MFIKNQSTTVTKTDAFKGFKYKTKSLYSLYDWPSLHFIIRDLERRVCPVRLCDWKPAGQFALQRHRYNRILPGRGTAHRFINVL